MQCDVVYVCPHGDYPTIATSFDLHTRTTCVRMKNVMYVHICCIAHTEGYPLWFEVHRATEGMQLEIIRFHVRCIFKKQHRESHSTSKDSHSSQFRGLLD